jgi:hypothetical protein
LTRAQLFCDDHQKPQRGNGKIEKINSDLNHTMTRERLEHPDASPRELLHHAILVHNRTPRPSGYSLYSLFYGTQPPDKQLFQQAYTRELTEEEEYATKREFVKQHEATVARGYATGLKASRDQI